MHLTCLCLESEGARTRGREGGRERGSEEVRERGKEGRRKGEKEGREREREEKSATRFKFKVEGSTKQLSHVVLMRAGSKYVLLRFCVVVACGSKCM